MIVDVVGRKVENQVQFWSLLGPFFVLLSIAVLLFKVSPHWYFPVSALIAIPICVKWKLKGMAVALSCLFLLAGISFQNLELDDRYWHVGLSLAMAFSFIVLTLSLEEVQGLVYKVQLESQSRLDNFLLLDEKWSSAELEWSFEKEKTKNEIEVLAQEVTKVQEDKQTFYKLAQLSKDELIQVRGQHDALLQDLIYKKQQIAQLNEHLEESELTVQEFVNSDAEKQIQALKECIEHLEREKETFKANVIVLQEEGQAHEIARERILKELQDSQENEKKCLIEQQRHRQNNEEQHQVFLALKNQYTLLEQEKETLFLKCEEMKGHSLLQEKQIRQKDQEFALILDEIQNKLEEEKCRSDIQIRQVEQQFLEKNELEIKTLEDRCLLLQQNLTQTQSDLQAKNDALTLIQEQMEELSNQLSDQRSLLRESTEHSQNIQDARLQLEEMLKLTQGELQEANRKLETRGRFQESEKQYSVRDENTRCIDSMYKQLRDQFQEKSQVLDLTRRELFCVNEKLLKFQRDYQEEHLYDQPGDQLQLQQYLIRLGKQFEQMQANYQQEIDDLTHVIGHLLKELKYLRN